MFLIKAQQAFALCGARREKERRFTKARHIINDKGKYGNVPMWQLKWIIEVALITAKWPMSQS